MWLQHTLGLSAKTRGFHLITDEILQQLPALSNLQAGMPHLFLLHTSASLTLNENGSPAMRRDMEHYFCVSHRITRGTSITMKGRTTCPHT